MKKKYSSEDDFFHDMVTVEEQDEEIDSDISNNASESNMFVVLAPTMRDYKTNYFIRLTTL